MKRMYMPVLPHIIISLILTVLVIVFSNYDNTAAAPDFLTYYSITIAFGIVILSVVSTSDKEKIKKMKRSSSKKYPEITEYSYLISQITAVLNIFFAGIAMEVVSLFFICNITFYLKVFFIILSIILTGNLVKILRKLSE
ncbi:MAG: hypothetical protein ACK5NF_03480 [Bacilli bacterium]